MISEEIAFCGVKYGEFRPCFGQGDLLEILIFYVRCVVRAGHKFLRFRRGDALPRNDWQFQLAIFCKG